MIKKIGSNKYGVVEYAISSVEDIADLPLGVAIGSTAVLIDKDGIRTFALGEGEWVEYIDAERYDKNKLAQDLLFCGFGNDGEKHDDLDDRLMVEFDEINERVNVGNYLEYNGCNVKADYSLEGLQRGVMLEGRTLQNLVDGKNMIIDASDNTTRTISLRANLLKINTTYTFILNVKRNTLTRPLRTLSFEEEFLPANKTLVEVGQTGVVKTVITTTATTKVAFGLSTDNISGIESGTQVIEFDLMVLEGDHTQTLLEELPFIEGIESVGEGELTDDGYRISGKSCGKNLLNINSSEKTADGARAEIEGNTLTVTQSFEGSWRYYGVKLNNLKPNTTYTFSATIIGDNSCRARIFDTKTYKEIAHFNSYNGKVSFTPKINLDSIWAFFYTSYNETMPVGTVAIFKDIMLEEGTTATPYEPYKETTYSYTLDEPLRSLPNGVCDTIDLETGVLTRRVGKVVLNGSESWKIYQEKPEENKINTISFICDYNGAGIVDLDYHYNICDKFPSLNHYNYDLEGVFVKQINSIRISINRSRLSKETVAGFKEWLQVNPTTLYYKLGEPTIHQLDQNRIYSFKDITHVVSDNLIAPRITTNILTNSNALISHLKGENLALANEVSTLSLRNRETQETNETQDHIIDASLCAVDELYMMYETTQEVEPMSTSEEGSRMVDMYVAMVQRGLKTIDQVPVRYREKVREILAQLED